MNKPIITTIKDSVAKHMIRMAQFQQIKVFDIKPSPMDKLIYYGRLNSTDYFKVKDNIIKNLKYIKEVKNG